MGELSWWHWLIIGGAFILLFGAKKLPEAARGVGRSLRILKSEVSAMHDEEQSATAPTTTPPPTTPTVAAPTAAATVTAATVPAPVSITSASSPAPTARFRPRVG